MKLFKKTAVTLLLATALAAPAAQADGLMPDLPILPDGWGGIASINYASGIDSTSAYLNENIPQFEIERLDDATYGDANLNMNMYDAQLKPVGAGMNYSVEIAKPADGASTDFLTSTITPTDSQGTLNLSFHCSGVNHTSATIKNAQGQTVYKFLDISCSTETRQNPALNQDGPIIPLFNFATAYAYPDVAGKIVGNTLNAKVGTPEKVNYQLNKGMRDGDYVVIPENAGATPYFTVDKKTMDFTNVHDSLQVSCQAPGSNGKVDVITTTGNKMVSSLNVNCAA